MSGIMFQMEQAHTPSLQAPAPLLVPFPHVWQVEKMEEDTGELE